MCPSSSSAPAAGDLCLQAALAPVFGLNDGFKSYILPAIALASIDAALVARLTRGSMLEVMRADYVRTATAKGLSKRVVIFKHVLRNSIIPVVTYLGISFGTLLGGALITENVFSARRASASARDGHPAPTTTRSSWASSPMG